MTNKKLSYKKIVIALIEQKQLQQIHGGVATKPSYDPVTQTVTTRNCTYTCPLPTMECPTLGCAI